MPRMMLLRHGIRLGWLFALPFLAPNPAGAFPPAPFNTLYGMVRDENGQTLRVEGAEVVFYKGATEVLRQTISEGPLLDQNYQIRLRMDMFRPGSRTYSSQASSSGTAFTLAVVLNSITYYPIEMSTPRTVGRPGERVRLDLTLGIDSDGDGLPDAWEESQLYAGGILPGETGWDLSLIGKSGDFDGDGVSNWNEYIAGTYATDATDYLGLEIREPLVSHVRLQFFSIYGRVYSLESSTDLQTWSAASLYLRNPESTDSDDVANPPAPQASLSATTTGIVDIYAAADASGKTFYRLKVR